MASMAGMQRLIPKRFRWEDVGFELDNLEKDMDDQWFG
jgi:hypothetical protein